MGPALLVLERHGSPELREASQYAVAHLSLLAAEWRRSSRKVELEGSDAR